MTTLNYDDYMKQINENDKLRAEVTELQQKLDELNLNKIKADAIRGFVLDYSSKSIMVHSLYSVASYAKEHIDKIEKEGKV